MQIKKGQKYKIHFKGREYYLVKVKVTELYSKNDGSQWVEWRYNMPAPIYEVSKLDDFTNWVLNKM